MNCSRERFITEFGFDGLFMTEGRRARVAKSSRGQPSLRVNRVHARASALYSEEQIVISLINTLCESDWGMCGFFVSKCKWGAFNFDCGKCEGGIQRGDVLGHGSLIDAIKNHSCEQIWKILVGAVIILKIAFKLDLDKITRQK